MNRLHFVGSLWILSALVFPVSGQSEELKKITIGVTSTSFANAPVFLTQRMRFFEKHGIEAEIVVAESSAVAMSGLIANSFDVVNTATPELITLRAKGQNVVALSRVYAGSAGTLVLSTEAIERIGVAPDAPITDRLKALDGLKIATPSALSSFTTSFFGAARAAGAKPEPVYLAQGSMVAALESDAIDGFIASAPYWGGALLSGSGLPWISGPQGELGDQFTFSSAGVYVVKLGEGEADLHIADQIVQAHMDFVEAVKVSPADVQVALSELYPTLDQKSLQVLYENESLAWKAPLLTHEEILEDVKEVVASGADVPGLVDVDSSSLIFSSSVTKRN